jgi:hypothetical protein
MMFSRVYVPKRYVYVYSQYVCIHVCMYVCIIIMAFLERLISLVQPCNDAFTCMRDKKECKYINIYMYSCMYVYGMHVYVCVCKYMYVRI